MIRGKLAKPTHFFRLKNRTDVSPQHNHSIIIVLIMAVFFFQAGTVSSAEDGGDPSQWSAWPQWMGPTRNAYSPEKGLLREWPDSGPELLWKHDLYQDAYASGWGSPSIYDGCVYILGRHARHATGNKNAVWCLDALSGKDLWCFEYKSRKKEKMARAGWGYCPRSAVTVTKDFVYTLDDVGELYCLDRKKGTEVWYKDLDEKYKPSHFDWKGWCASPIVSDGVAAFFVGSKEVYRVSEEKPGLPAKYVGLDAKSGKTVWEYEEPGGTSHGTFSGGWVTRAAPQITMFEKENCLLDGVNGRLTCIRMRDGKKVWGLDKVHRGPLIATPQIFGKYLLFTQAWGGGATLYEIDRTQAPFTSKHVWSNKNIYRAYWASVCLDGFLYTFAYPIKSKKPHTGPNFLRCLKLTTGKVVWEKESFPMGVSIMMADSLLFCRSGPTLMLVNATPEGFAKKGEIDLAALLNKKEVRRWGRCGWVMPSLAYGRLYVRARNHILCFRVSSKLPSRKDLGLTLKN